MSVLIYVISIAAVFAMLAIIYIIANTIAKPDVVVSLPPAANTPPPATAPVIPPPFVVPKNFMVKNDTGSFCLDDGGVTAPGTVKFKWFGCNIGNNNQHFRYDAASKQLKNMHKPDLCMDDGGSPNQGVWMHGCDTSNKNQSWDVLPDPAGKGFRFTNNTKPGLCMQADNPGVHSSTFSMRPCSDSVSQLFTFASF